MLLHSSDSAPAATPANNLISIQLDSITLNKIIADSESLGKVVKKINFRDVNGFKKLVKGESSKFSYVDEDRSSVCDVSCNVRCDKIPMPTAAPPKPFIAKKDSVKGPPYLPPFSKKDEGIAPQRTTSLPVTKLTTEKNFKPSLPHSLGLGTKAKQITTRPTISVTQRRTSTPGPTYLPVARVSTAKRLAVTEKSYPPATWPSTTRLYTQTFPKWSPPDRQSTSPKIATSTAKYLYKEPSNSLIYAGEAEK